MAWDRIRIHQAGRGHGVYVRVGIEDNVYLSRGALARNDQLVERAVRILDAMNIRVLGPEEVREKLDLRRGR
jgi:uncharacterized protein (DUF849 family)